MLWELPQPKHVSVAAGPVTGHLIGKPDAELTPDGDERVNACILEKSKIPPRLTLQEFCVARLE
jgi:hypothetical protein